MPLYDVQSRTRDSLELASLASSSQFDPGAASDVSSRQSISSSRRLSLVEEDPLDNVNPADEALRGRGYSVSSTFDYAANLFPLSSSAGGGGYAPIGAPTSASRPAGGLGGSSLEKHKTLTYLNGLSLIVGLIIGSGIFSSPSEVSSKVGSPGAALVVWVIAGTLAWTGAASYAELGGAIPLNGGAQVYLAKIFGELAGFLFTWVAMLVLKPGSAAIIAIIMGEYFVRAIIGAEAEHVSPWINKGVALVGIITVTFLNCISTKLGTRVNDTLMFLKFVGLVGVTVVGIVVAFTGFSYKEPANTEWKEKPWFEGTTSDLSAWAVALYAGLWAFDGWDNVSSPISLHILRNILTKQLKIDQLCRGRIPQPKPRSTPRYSHSYAPCHSLLRLRQRRLFPGSSSREGECLQYSGSHVWIPRFRSRRVSCLSSSCQCILLRRS